MLRESSGNFLQVWYQIGFNYQIYFSTIKEKIAFQYQEINSIGQFKSEFEKVVRVGLVEKTIDSYIFKLYFFLEL